MCSASSPALPPGDIEAELLSQLGAGGLAKLQRVLRHLAPED